mmetsp:Transcript_49300/g.94221  ORF Transcript_49300/g.94221 Transcript_49300/m.94221 type:complete len:82 (-) Transcript_49300:103-348(-)
MPICQNRGILACKEPPNQRANTLFKQCAFHGCLAIPSSLLIDVVKGEHSFLDQRSLEAPLEIQTLPAGIHLSSHGRQGDGS